MDDPDNDLDGFLFGDDSDVATDGRQRHDSGDGGSTGGTRSRRAKNSTESAGDRRRTKDARSSSSLSDSSESRRNTASTKSSGDEDRRRTGGKPLRKSTRKSSRRRHGQRRARGMDEAIDAALSSNSGSSSSSGCEGDGLDDDGDDQNRDRSRKKGGKKLQSRLKPRLDPELQTLNGRDRYKAGDAVEARFGGRSKWFPGKVRRAHEGATGGVLYDVDFDDGDKEEGILAGRVRSPGQSPPSLQAGLAVDVKLARKGKGYHAGTIGRVNDDGTLYVKLQGGDSEWSLPAQQIIPIYPYNPTSATAAHVVGAGPHASQCSAPADSRAGDRSGAYTKPGGVAPASSSTVPTGEARCETNGQQQIEDGGSGGADDTGEGGGRRGEGDRDGGEDAGVTWIAELAQKKKESQQQGGGNVAGGGDGSGGGGTGNGGVGVSWIAELAGAVGVSPSPAAKTEMHKGGPPEENVGLSWIADVVSIAQAESATKSVAAGNLSPVPNPSTAGFSPSTLGPATSTPGKVSSRASAANATASAIAATAVVAAAGPCTPAAATKTQTPKPLTPSHLEWRPITDGSANRRWGAPGPDMAANEGSGKGQDSAATEGLRHPNQQRQQYQQQQHQQKLESPPRLCRHMPVTTAAAAASVSKGARASTLPRSEQHDPAGEPAVDVSDDKSLSISSSAASGKEPRGGGSGGSGSDTKLPSNGGDLNASAAGQHESRPGSETAQAHDGENIRRSAEDADGEKPVSRDSRDPGKGDPERPAAPNACPGELKAPPPSPHDRVSATAHDGNGQSGLRWERLRSSVQRRFAVEAMHLSEEVRFLTAKLKVADNDAQERLEQYPPFHTMSGEREWENSWAVDRLERSKLKAQINRQEREIGARMNEALRREREKALALLREERAASARRVTALKEELDATKRQLEIERNRGTRGAAHELSRGRRARTPPPSYFTTAGGRTTPEAATRGARRDEDRSRTHGTPLRRIPPWEERRLPPPPPRALVDASTPGNRLEAKSQPTIRSDFFQRLESEFLVPPTSGALPNSDIADVCDATASLVGGRGNPSVLDRVPMPLRREQGAPHRVRCTSTAAAAAAAAAVGRVPVAAEPAAVDSGFTGESTADNFRRIDLMNRDEGLRWELVKERRNTRRCLRIMKAEVERVVTEFRARAERAEEAAASAEKRAALKALRYLRSKQLASPMQG